MKKVDWEKRKKRGKPKAIESPEKMWEFACEYFAEVDNSPWKKKELIRGGELAGAVIDIDTVVPYSWSGLYTFLWNREIISDLDDYRKNTDNAYTKYREVLKAIEQVIYTQKFAGASVGAFNANLIARDLQLTDHKSLDINANRKKISDLFPSEEDMDETEG